MWDIVFWLRFETKIPIMKMNLAFMHLAYLPIVTLGIFGSLERLEDLDYLRDWANVIKRHWARAKVNLASIVLIGIWNMNWA